MRVFTPGWSLVWGLVAAVWAGGAVRAEVTVSAAISLKEVLTEVAEGYRQETGEGVRVNVGASGQLMEQVKNGAAVDVFISAGPGQVEELERAGKVVGGTRRVVATNRLVLIVPGGKEPGVKGFDDLGKGEVRRVAVGKPRAVPAGDYAVEVFEKVGVMGAVRGKLVYGANVRQVLDYVRRGEVDAGVVYATDVGQEGERVKVVAAAPAGSHRAIEYVGVVVKGTREAEAAGRFLEHLGSEEAREVMSRRGFGAGEGRPGK